jgi:hypothetical protein
MKVPVHLKHEPVYAIEDYNKMDGIYIGRSDSPCLSIGLAQWNQRGTKDISAKVWRNNGPEDRDYEDGNWSRMSEELPIHRNLDLSILILEVIGMLKKGVNNKHTIIQGKDAEIRKIVENNFVDEDLAILKATLLPEVDDEIISSRLRKLADLLRGLGY